MGPSKKQDDLEITGQQKDLESGERLSPAQLDIGATLSNGRFLIQELLGQGSSGTVYRAFDHLRQHEIALKVLYENEGESLAQLKKEFRSLQGISHAGLVELYELHLNEAPPFFSMQVATGIPFDLALVKSAAPYEICRRLAEALDALHNSHRVHRDIKPNNILVRENGELKILDFGVSIDLNAETAYALRVGTPNYIAPEVLAGKKSTQAADAYAVGVLLYKSFSGRFPDLLDRIPLSQLVVEINKELSEAIAKLTSPCPVERLTMREFSRLCQRLTKTRYSLAMQSSERPAKASFFGRKQELDILCSALSELQERNTTQLIHLEGASGMGKSRLIDEFRATCPQALILRSVCFENELIPHKLLDGLVDHLKQYLMGQDDRAVQRLISASEASDLVRTFPELGTIPGFYQRQKKPDIKDLPQLRRRGEKALARLLYQLGNNHELIIIFDDIQWGDAESAKAFLRILGTNLKHKALIIFAYRPDERSTNECLQQILRGANTLEDHYNCRKLHLGPLSTSAGTALFNSLVTVPATSAQHEQMLHAASGSPLLILEIAVEYKRVKSAQLTIQDIVVSRLNSMSSSARQAFELLSCSPTPLATRTLFALLKIESSLLQDKIRTELQQLNLIRPRTGGLDLEVTHDLFRTSAQQLMGTRIRDYHLKLAQHFELSAADIAKTAFHFHGARQIDKASTYSEKSAVFAENSLAFLQAARHYEDALEAEERNSKRAIRMRSAMAQAYSNAGCPHLAAEKFLEVATLTSGKKAISSRAHAAEQWLMSGKLELGERALASSLKSVGLNWPKSQLAVLLKLLWNRGCNSVLQIIFKGGRKSLAGKFDAKLQALGLANIISYVSTLHGVANNALYLKVAMLSGDKQHLGLALGMESIYRAAAGSTQHKAVQAFYLQSKSLLDPECATFNRGFLAYVRGQGHYLLHDYAAACIDYQLAEDALSQHGRNVSFQLTSSRILWASALTYCGKNREFFRRTNLWAEEAQARGDLYGEVAFRIQLARVDALHHLDSTKLQHTLEGLLSRWQSSHFSLHDSLARYAQISLDLAVEEPLSALQRLTKLAKDAKFSFSKVQSVRIFDAQQRAKAYLQLASQSAGTTRKAYQKQALVQCHRLKEEKSAWATTLAEHVEACATLGELPEKAKALDLLRKTQRAYIKRGLNLYVAAVSLQLIKHDVQKYCLEHQETLKSALLAADFNDTKTILNLYAPRISVN